MIDLSLAGLIGAFLGTAVAAFAYAPLVSSIQRYCRARAASEAADESRNLEERETLTQEMSLLRRSVLAVDIIMFASLGYWLAVTVAG